MAGVRTEFAKDTPGHLSAFAAIATDLKAKVAKK